MHNSNDTPPSRDLYAGRVQMDALIGKRNTEPLNAWPKICASHSRRLIGRQSKSASQKLIYKCLFCSHELTIEERFESKGYGRARKTLILEER